MGKFKIPPVPEGVRNIDYIILNEEHQHKIGVYIMFVGDMFYIGRAKNIRSRILSHRWQENTCLMRFLYGRKIKSNRNIINLLALDHNINTIEVDILEVCQSEVGAKIAERQWLKAVYHTGFHHMLLNSDRFGLQEDTYLDMYSPLWNNLMDTSCDV